MKIAVNGRFLTKPFTGIGQYTLHLMSELSKQMKKDEFVLFVPEKVSVKFPKNVKVEVLPERKRGGAGMRKTWWEQVQVPEAMKKAGADLAFFPYPANPWPKDFKIRTAVTVHDTIPWTDKRYQRGVLSRFYHRMTKRAVKNADLVMTVSKASKKDIVKVCDVKKSKVKVVHNDVDPIYRKKAAAAKVLKKYKLEKEKYLLYCGGFDVRKNVPELVAAYGEFAEKNKDVKLVLAGGKVLKSDLYGSFDKAKSKAGKIVKTGFLDPKDLAALYQNCLGFVHLSEKEGFNIPVVEAAAGGAPLILSDTKVHREVAGDGAQYGDTLKAMNNLKREWAKWSKKSKKVAEKFSWKKSAQQVKDMLS